MDNTGLKGPEALGTFLRVKRENTSPEMLGIPVLSRRRTKGLRREEVAQMSGISTTWYTWLEQGRDITVSAQTLSGIAFALKLKPAEREYLFLLAHKSDPLIEQVPAVEQTILSAVYAVSEPCYLLDLTWQVLSWNKGAETLFKGFLDSEKSPNMMHFMFLNPLARTLVDNWEVRARRIVAELRSDAIHYPNDTTLNAFVQQMSENSSDFREFWSQQQVIVREGGARVFHHATRGDLTYRQLSWQLASNRALKMIMLVPESC
ncbi:helix-turn-helix transcriptional regulator [Kluyvera ascorbata]|uniref:Helix-turn-helix transcriptional regulator n=1 Tax=Kluyvera ascorbata TaxID=51288 RepID=A0AB35X4A4_9ENTR|nr:helix-turn-helix transcriptional regulator [Kluyvera ascorbata]MDT8700365.1 helix-turn-helix transcriptional regulator [Kluyvera ascorbata]UPQ73912.1 helix-turn-helix transcriptional regulator [Kluyvera ascorbata]